MKDQRPNKVLRSVRVFTAFIATKTAVRDLTAKEIAGTTTTNQANAAAARRTPSQISTSLLLAYMKEPGEHEFTIIQQRCQSWYTLVGILSMYVCFFAQGVAGHGRGSVTHQEGVMFTFFVLFVLFHAF